MKKYYLAYGSNLNIESMRMRCPSAVPVGTTNIKNYKLEFRGTPGNAYLTLTASIDDVVPLGVWEIDKNDEKCLDRYEGYPSLYRKVRAKDVRVKTFTNGTIIVDAFLYIMNKNYPINAPRIFYANTCISGFNDFSLPQEALEKAFDQLGEI